MQEKKVKKIKVRLKRMTVKNEKKMIVLDLLVMLRG